MNNLTTMDYKELLPRSQHATFDKLEGTLKNLFTVQLLPAGFGIHIEVAIIALDIISQFDVNNEVVRKNRDRFFIEFLSEINVKTETALKEILEITQKGFFSDFLNNVDFKKKKHYTANKIITLVNKFHSQILPALIIQRENKQRTLLPRTDLQDSLPIQQMHEKLMECRTYFAFSKLSHEFLAFLPLNKKWKESVYSYFFFLLDVEYSINFDDLEKLNICQAIFLLHSPLRKKMFEHCSEIDLKEFINLCDELKSEAGEEVLDYYFTSLSQSQDSNINKMIGGLKLLLARSVKEDFYEFIDQWEKDSYKWDKLFETQNPDVSQIKIKNIEIQDDIQTRLQRFKDDPTVTQPLSDGDLCLIERQYQKINELCQHHDHLEFNQLMSLAHQIRQLAKQQPIDEANRLLLIAIGCLAIRDEFKLFPYSTQILALLGLLADGKSRQAQVKTGEGKSMIVALWAFVMAMESRAVDIITSARYLAVRDYDKFTHFFKRCGITSSHICYDRKLPKYFQAQILYGPAFDFEFAWMEDLLWGSKLYEERLKTPFVSRNFDALCVDESDNLLIDTSRNGARLSYPAEESYCWVYAPILSFVNTNKDLVKNNLNMALPLLKKYLNDNVAEQNQKNCLLLSDKQLETWLKSAFHALFELSEINEYVIAEKRDVKGKIKRSIQIVDLKTGRVSESSRWSNGIHEFLEVKHDITVEKESLNAISLSHAVFYPFYKTISALTGTAERFQTQEIYQISSFDVPPHRELQRVDLPPIIVENRQSYLGMVVQKTKQCIQSKRPILILCPTIQETKLLGIQMQDEKIEYQLLNDVQEELEQIILSKAGAPFKVTIATNAAGRGTDILLTKESLENGGLHVLLGFYPDTKRDEDQAIGRAGRQGQPGSSQMILNKEDLITETWITPEDLILTDAEIMEILNKQRKLKEKSQINVQVACADLERFLAKKTTVFFEKFRNWSDKVDQDAVLEKFAQKLSSIRMKSNTQLDFTHLGFDDLILAEECKRLLLKKPGMIAWKVFLQKLTERLKKKVINEWVKFFFEPADKQLKQVAVSINSPKIQLEGVFKQYRDLKKDQNSEIINLIGEEFIEILKAEVETAKKEVDQKFEAHQSNWEKYLALDGIGLFVYLKDVIGINLISLVLK